MLHLVHQSPFHSTQLENCLRVYRHEDVLLLMQDAVYAALLPLSKILDNTRCYALLADVKARGLSNKITSSIPCISYEEFVDLTVHYHPIRTW